MKNRLLKITSNTIDVFQSSDGESIPFGNNWVHKIEDNLMNTKLMFVFVSPNSLESNWIYFEAGFSYSRGIKVIPIGIHGIDIGQLAPPMNLLQGFNITSHEGLNNIITIINREFDTSYSTDFTIEDYENILINTPYFKKTIKFFNNIDYINTTFYNIKESAFDDVCIFLKENSIKHTIDDKKRIYFHGMIVSADSKKIDFSIDVYSFEENFKVICQLKNILHDQIVDRYWMSINFNENMELLSKDFKLSSRLYNTGIEMSLEKNNFFEFKNLLFTIDDKHVENDRKITKEKNLRVVFNFDSFNPETLYELISLLIEQKIIKTVG
jgi:hypothetical protein